MLDSESDCPPNIVNQPLPRDKTDTRGIPIVTAVAIALVGVAVLGSLVALGALALRGDVNHGRSSLR